MILQQTPEMTSEQAWLLDWDAKQIERGYLERSLHIEYKGCYISILPMHTSKSLYGFSVYAGQRNITNFFRASYDKGVSEAKEIVDQAYEGVLA